MGLGVLRKMVDDIRAGPSVALKETSSRELANLEKWSSMDSLPICEGVGFDGCVWVPSNLGYWLITILRFLGRETEFHPV